MKQPQHSSTPGTSLAKNPLEQAIGAYEKKAREIFKHDPADGPLTAESRERKRQRALVHLTAERAHIGTLETVQARLDDYRQKARLARDSLLPEGVRQREKIIAERHHPTKDLVAFMRAEGRPQPSPLHSAHHIVCGRGKTQAMREARQTLHAVGGIGINDPDNGVWMPRATKDTPHWATPQTPPHSRIHTKGYEGWVVNRIRLGSDENSMRTQLQIMGRQLEEGTLPKGIIKGKLENTV